MPEFDETFWTAEGRYLRKPELFCLIQDAALYQTLLLQTREDILYNETGIWISDHDRACSKFRTFFHLAAERHADLTITPEYSCPWSVIGELIDEGRLPERQRLWIIGCQSINARVLLDFISKHPQIEWIYERELVHAHLDE